MADPAKMQLEDWLDDLCVRFIINLPQEDLSSVARICFQVEEAQWFYEDYVRPLDPTLPSMSLRTFCLRIFQHCPLLSNFSVENHTRAFEEFLQYKTRVPVRGAIMLNQAMDSAVLVKGWKKGANWSFPRGKINKDEDDLDCAIREVYEETGFDIRSAGLVPEPDAVKYIEITMREQQMRLYVFRDVPMDTHFEPRTRKEISKIQWYRLSELPAFRKKGSQPHTDAAVVANANKFYMVAPFLVPLKKWVMQQKKREAIKIANEPYLLAPHPPPEELATEDDAGASTEPTFDLSKGMRALDTLEGATLELQRLLKVQPSSHGLQQPAQTQRSSQPPPELDQDKGGALLAILQSKSGATASQPSQPQMQAQIQPNSHTPRDVAASEAVQSNAPHHHYSNQNAAANAYQHPQHFPAMPTSGAPSWDPYQQYTSGPMIVQQRVPEEPVMVTPHQGANQPALVHPQPLPPQVQLSRGVFYSTPPPPPNNMPGSQQPPGPASSMRYQQGRAGAAHQQVIQSQIDSSGLSTALLQTFKAGTTAMGQPQAGGAQYGVSSTVQGSAVQTLQSQVSGHQAYYQTGRMAGPPGSMQTSGQTTSSLPNAKAAPPTDQHRSALLGLLKKPDATTGAKMNISPPTAHNSQPPPHMMQSQVSNNSSYQQNKFDIAGQLRMASLQSQNQQAQIIQPHSVGQRASHDTRQPTIGVQRNGASAAPQSVPTPHRREVMTSPAGPSHGRLTQGAPTSLVTPPTGAGFPVPGMLTRKSEASTEQRQRLLSLFGPKQPSSAANAGMYDKGKAKEATSSDTARSRVASLVSATGEGLPSSQRSSRQGNRTPISPANRNFLLGYLESVTSGANR